MTLEEYKANIKKADEDCFNQKKQIAKEYAFSNNPYKVGDKITDHISSIRITSISFYSHGWYEIPGCIYTGDNLLKTGAINKREPIRKVHQSNIL